MTALTLCDALQRKHWCDSGASVFRNVLHYLTPGNLYVVEKWVTSLEAKRMSTILFNYNFLAFEYFIYKQ